ncbi:DNA-processing protein DprA [Streptomyces sp. NPDC127038]|uniref:DNA-processing protein DprA n=1 Tax=Streptomyces sp. NPDC127038 TaxID=3347114 RepID=UPI00365B5F84
MPSSALSERAARAALSANFAPEQINADLAQHSPAEVWEQRVRRDNTGRLAQYRPEAELSNAQLTCRFLIPCDPQWPARLTDLGPATPLGLWARGHEHLPKLTTSTIVVTGNRAAGPQTIARAREFAGALAETGHTVAASLAYGVDTAAHEAALLIGPTLAVLPRGLDQAHPHTHAQLLKTITGDGGAAVSLYRPGTVPSGATLQASARLLVALAHTVILIEALDHSQALRTAEAAIALNRSLLAVPSDGAIRSDGNARLLDERLALPCPTAARALELL